MNHGGQRNGAGRPPKSKTKKVPITITLPPEHVEWLDLHENRSETIRHLIDKEIKRGRQQLAQV